MAFRTVGIPARHLVNQDWTLEEKISPSLPVQNLNPFDPVRWEKGNAIVDSKIRKLKIEDAIKFIDQGWVDAINAGQVWALVSPKKNGVVLARSLTDRDWEIGWATGSQWSWIALRKDEAGWNIMTAADKVTLGGSFRPFVGFSENYLVALSASGDEESCELVVHDLSSGGRIATIEAGFFRQIASTISEKDGLIFVSSQEWYGTTSLELFDLQSGAAGPWLLIERQNDSDWHAVKNGVIKSPPWGDQLRRAMLGEVDPAAARGQFPPFQLDN